jgi:hypothetical protein
MSLSDQALASAESAALRTEALESDAEKRVDQEFAAAAANGTDPRTSAASATGWPPAPTPTPRGAAGPC